MVTAVEKVPVVKVQVTVVEPAIDCGDKEELSPAHLCMDFSKDAVRKVG